MNIPEGMQKWYTHQNDDQVCELLVLYRTKQVARCNFDKAKGGLRKLGD